MGQTFQLEFPSSPTLLLCQASCRVYTYTYTFSVLTVTWAMSSRCSDTGCIDSALEQGGNCNTFIKEDLGDICRRTKWWTGKKEQIHTENMKLRGKEGHLQNTPCQQHTERTTARSPAPVELAVVTLWGSGAPHSLDLLSVTTASTRMVVCFKKPLNRGVKIPHWDANVGRWIFPVPHSAAGSCCWH